MSRGSALLALVLTSCVTPAKFGSELDRLTCEREYECAQGAFDALYGDVGECRAELDEATGDLFQCELASCTFDTTAARQCLHDLRTAPCDEIVDGSAAMRCDEVFVDCDMTALYACAGA